MQYIEPQVHLIGETKIFGDGLDDYFESINASDWTTDAPSDSEKLTEVMARSCYMSFDTPSQSVSALNKNLSSAREGNERYLNNIKEHRHGSVLEHTTVNFMFTNVSRVVTHELVRHRAGTAISQQSMRYVRTDIDGMYLPLCILNDPKALDAAHDLMRNNKKGIERLETMLGLRGGGLDFHERKERTSALRRFKYQGVPTQIGWSANFRALRHVIEMRTSPGAEEEIRILFGKVARLCMERYPNVFGDYHGIEDASGLIWYQTENVKV